MVAATTAAAEAVESGSKILWRELEQGRRQIGKAAVSMEVTGLVIIQTPVSA